MFELMYNTPVSWAEGVVDAMDDFLPDHAAAEKKPRAWQWAWSPTTRTGQNW